MFPSGMVCTPYPHPMMNYLLIYLGEFGPIYERPDFNPDWKVQNDERYEMLDKQLAIYSSESIGK